MKNYKKTLINEMVKNGLNLDLAIDVASVLLPDLNYYNQKEREDREFTRLNIIKKSIQETLIKEQITH